MEYNYVTGRRNGSDTMTDLLLICAYILKLSTQHDILLITYFMQ